MRGDEQMTKQLINGREFDLTSGVRYIASRPFFERGQQLCTVSIRELDTDKVVDTVPNLTYDQSNDLLCAFNNGATSFEGRAW